MTIEEFRKQLSQYDDTLKKYLGGKFIDFVSKAIYAVEMNKELLKCTPESLFGSILFFAEIQLPFDTPEGYGYIDIETTKGKMEAVPIPGYKGLLEIAYRNPSIKKIRIQSVYANDEFDYGYGTKEYINHKPAIKGPKGDLVAVYAIAHIQDIDPMFVVVSKTDLDALQKLSNSGNSQHAKADVFNIMQAKVALKLLFKTLPKQGNEALTHALELDNKFDYEKNTRIVATTKGYEIVEKPETTNVLASSSVPVVKVKKTAAFKEKQQESKKN